MKLTLKRKFLGVNYTIGDLFIDDKFFCNTIEDTVRELLLFVQIRPKAFPVHVQAKSMQKPLFRLVHTRLL